MGTLSRLSDFETDRDAVPPVLISATKMDAEFDQLVTESNAQDVRLDAAEAAGHVSTADLAADAVDGTKIADNAIDSEHYVDGSIDNAHIADDAIDSEHYVDGSIDNAHIADDAIDSEHYVDGSIDNAHIADDAIDSEHYADGSIDNAHIADDAIDSEHYADGSIDLAHLSADCVDGTKLADNAVDSEHYTDASIDSAHIGADQVITAKILDSNVTLPKIVDASATNKVLGRVAAGSGNWEEVTLETTLSSTDEAIPTSKAVRDDIVSLVNDVGGFHAIADDQSFPNTNPDPDDGAGTVVSIANAGGLVVNGSGVTTTGRTLGASTVTITGIPSTYQSTTIADTLGMHVISTVTLNTYTYHKIIAKEGDTNIVATNIANVNTVAGISANVTTVAGISANTTTVAGISANVTTVAGISSDVTTVAADASDIGVVAADGVDIGVVAGQTTEIGRLGTAAAVADMALLAIPAVITDMDLLGASGVIDDMETVSNAITNVNNVGGSIANVNTVGASIDDVDRYAEEYKISASAPSSALTAGDLWFDTGNNILKVYNAGTSTFVAVTSSTAGISNVVDDTSPQLGGNLELQAYTLSNVSLANGGFYSNPNTITADATVTTAALKNMFLMGQITVNDTYTWTIAGDGVLQII
tara:strand:+ start:1700 stop:3637 length:1938 start_codon:yes stop_codon:yes gene_type:complete